MLQALRTNMQCSACCHSAKLQRVATCIHSQALISSTCCTWHMRRYVGEDELIEVTPTKLRLRKRVLDSSSRKAERRRAAA